MNSNLLGVKDAEKPDMIGRSLDFKLVLHSFWRPFQIYSI